MPAHALLWLAEVPVPYECDGLTAYRERPLVVVLPETEDQVAAVLKACHALQVPVVARGAGTGLSGGAMPNAMGVTLSLAKFNRIIRIDPRSRTAVVQAGVRNLAISEAAAPHGLYYAPDPSSQIACTIGGNVAENSGGVHCLKYGLTLHNVLRVRGYTVEGEPVEFGSEALDAPGLDLLSLVLGSGVVHALVTSVPCQASQITAWSSAVRVKNPATSSVGANAITPDKGYAWRVGLRPTTPQAAAGWRIEPPVSVPVAAGARPAATAAAEPPEDPPGVRPSFQGLCVAP